MQKLQWQTVSKRVNDLIPQDNNPRVITDKQMSDLQRNLKRFNLVEIPAVDKDGRILAGHQRIKALQLLGRGEEMIDVRLPNRKLTKSEAERYLIASNSLGGDWNMDKLKSFDLDLLLDIGFDTSELSKFWDKDLEVQDDEFDEEAEIKKIHATDVKPGDIYALGKHRLICGSSLDLSVVNKLMGSAKADMVNDDLPFNIGLSYDRGVGNKKGKYGGSTNDSKTDSEYREFVKTIMQNAISVSKPDCHYLFWCDERFVWLLQTLYKELSIDSKRLLIWIKNNSTPTHNVAFNKVTEFCVYGTRGVAPINNEVSNLSEIANKGVDIGNESFDQILDLLNIWMVKRLPSKDYKHPTQKSPDLHEKALKRCTRPGDVVLDLTAGSGSILSACEQLKRVAYLCEIEPIFCQVIINRFQKLTGLKAKLIN